MMGEQLRLGENNKKKNWKHKSFDAPPPICPGSTSNEICEMEIESSGESHPFVGDPPLILRCVAEKDGHIPGSLAFTRASPRAVGVLADEQRLSRAADAAVGLVPVLIVQEEVVPELVLGESKAATASSAPRGLPSRPSAPSLPCRGSTSRPRTGGAACAPGSSHSRCTALRGQPRGNGVTTPPGRATELERHLTKEVQGPYTGTPKRHWKKNLDTWEAMSQVMV